MTPLVSIIMGSTSDLPVMEKACKFLNDMQVPFEVNALSAHRTPDAVESFAKGAKARGVKVIIAAAGMAAALPGVIAASTTLPVIGVPIKGMLDGLDAMLSNHTDAPGNTRRNSRRERSHERSYPRLRDDCALRRRHRRKDGSVQGWLGREDRKGEQGAR